LKTMVAMGFVFGTYTVYMGCHVLAGQPIPDGIIFGSVLGAVCGLAGFTVSKVQTAYRTLKE
jgi:hypothetical protein